MMIPNTIVCQAFRKFMVLVETGSQASWRVTGFPLICPQVPPLCGMLQKIVCLRQRTSD